MIPPTVPTALADAVGRRWPERGPQWVGAVERELRDLCGRYASEPEQVLPARYGFVVTAEGAGGKLVLRASADPNGPSQAKVAAKLGEIAVGPRVHEVINTETGTWTVMERVEPGDSFSDVPPTDSAIDSLVNTLASMADATELDGLPQLTDWLRDRLLDDDLQDLPPGRIPAPRVDRAAALEVVAELSDHPSRGLGHCDLSPGNVLQHRDGHFLVIDPRDLDGDVSYDVAVLALKTPQYGTPDHVASTLARRLSLDTDRSAHGLHICGLHSTTLQPISSQSCCSSAAGLPGLRRWRMVRHSCGRWVR